LEIGGVAKFLALAAVAAKGFNYIAKSKSRSRNRSQSQTAGVLEKVSQDAGRRTRDAELAYGISVFMYRQLSAFISIKMRLLIS